MKIIFSFVITFLLFCTHSSAQDTVLTFFDKNKKEVKKKKKDGYYIQAITENDTPNWFVYCSNEFLRSLSATKLNELFPDGKISLSNYAGVKLKEGHILGGMRVGTWNEWYRDGSKRAVLFYQSDTSVAQRLLATDSVPKLQIHEKSVLVSVNTWYHRNGNIAAEEHYSEQGLFLHGSTWKGDGTPVYDKVKFSEYGSQQGAYFKGGSGGRNGLMQFLRERVRYPELALKDRIEGQTIVQFTIDDDGTVADIEVKTSSGNHSLDAEATSVVNLMNGLWEPAKVHNVPVPTYYMLPVTFRL